jgi:hypothetical protein
VGAPLPELGRTTVRLKAEAVGRGDDVDARAEVTTRRPAGQQGARRATVAESRMKGGRRGGVGWGGGRREEYGDEEPRRLVQVREEADRVPGVDSGGPAVWWGVRASAGWWTADSGRSAAT